MRGRKPLPTELHELNGNPSKIDIEARKDAEPKPIKGTPPKPKSMSKDANETWDYLCKHLEQMGILAESDQMAISMLCKNWSLLLEAECHINDEGSIIDVNGQLQKNQWFKVKEETEKTIIKLLTEFGLTPSSRSRIAIQKLGDKPGEAIMKFITGV